MLQGIEPRLLRAAERFQWSLQRLQIAQSVIIHQHKLREVAESLDVPYDNAKSMLCEARKQLRKQAQDECEPEAYGPEAALEDDPEGVGQHARALHIAMDERPAFEDCVEAVELVGAY